MKVKVSQAEGGIAFEFTPEATDPLSDGYTDFASNTAFIETAVALDSIHPDIVGLVALFLVGEFSAGIELDRPVSEPFAKAARRYRKGKAFGPASYSVLPRLRPEEPVPALSFSGGVDSYAALQLMPENTECYFLASVDEKGGKRHPKTFVSGYRACSHVRSLGRTAIAVRSDLEFIRNMVGLPDHLACAIPILVHADERSIGSVTFGTIAEAAYRTGSTTYTELKDRPNYTKVHDIFEAVGLPVHNVVVGLSEVITTKIVASGPFHGQAQSCMWGGEEPCGQCIKCVRKELLDMATTGEWISSSQLRLLMSATSARKRIAKVPMKLENVFAYVAWKCPHDDPFVRSWKRRLRVDRLNMEWMEKIIPSSLNWMVDDLRPHAVAKLSAYAQFMTSADLDNAKAFDMRDVVRDGDVMNAYREFKRDLFTIPA